MNNNLWTPSQSGPAVAEAPELLKIADGRVLAYTDTRTLLVDEEVVDTTPKEFELIKLLAEKVDTVVKDEEISERVWHDPEAYKTSNTQSVTLSTLRRKLGDELGHRQEGAIRRRPRLGYVALSSMSGLSLENIENQANERYLIADDRIEIDPEQQLIICDGEPRSAPPRLFKILTQLASSPNRVMSIFTLSMGVWGDHSPSTDSSIRVGISEIRKILGPELGDKKSGAIRTRQHIGYYAAKTLKGY